MSKEFYMSPYSQTFGVNDVFTVSKHGNSDWVSIDVCRDDQRIGGIVIRSKQEAEVLHFVLGQLLSIP